MSEPKLIPNLFRTEFSKIVGVLCKSYGIANIQLAEDIASETFLIAAETWSLKGIPDKPKAWLYSVAKNKTKDYFKRESLFHSKILPELAGQDASILQKEIDLSEQNIQDAQLRMLFNVCNPLLSPEAQVSLALRVLCGFGIEEIASALLTSKSTINKRLLRAKACYKKHQIPLELPEPEELEERQDNVLAVIYLLFNEGYYSSSAEKSIRKQLCLEAMRLLFLLINHQPSPQANALMALFCFHASRFEAREDEFGNPILYADQDIGKWSQELIAKGELYLHRSASGKFVTKYHLEAHLAFWHTQPEANQTKWAHILQLYNQLLQIEYSPVAALNRTYALSRARGKKEAIAEALKIDLKRNHFYHILLADLYHGIDQGKELAHLKMAMELAKTSTERSVIERKLAAASGE